MDATMTLTPLSLYPEALRVHEVVAIAQVLLAGEARQCEAGPPDGQLSLEAVAITQEGRVHCTGAAAPGITDVGIVMQALLERSHDRVPSALRYAIGRALHKVEAPPFESPTELASSLERFERGDRAGVIAEACSRVRTCAAARPQPVSSPSGPGERRRLGAEHAHMRRALRDADLKLYALQQQANPQHTADHSASHRLPIAACMIAGALLLAAGDAGPRAGALPERPPSVSSTGTDIALAAPVVQPVAAWTAPESGPGRTARVRPPSLERSSESRRVVVNAERPRPRTGASKRSRQLRAPASASRPAPRDDRGLLRIRFEWNNPFK